MRFYNTIDHPLRVYLEEESPGEMNKLIMRLNNKYSPDIDTNYQRSEDDICSLILHDDYEDKYYIVRGLIQIIIKETNSLGITCNNEVPVIETTLEYPEIPSDILEGITLRDYQLEGISSALAYKRGIVQVHTGGGKTEMIIGISRYLLDNTDMNILICVPTTNLLYQTQERLLKRGIESSHISLLGDGNRIDTSRRIIISTVASAFKRLDVSAEYMDWLSNVNCLMLDEAHHSKCRTWSTLIDRVAPEYLLGFSAEPFHRDKDHMISDLILRGLLGPVIHRVTMDYLVAHGFLSKPYVLAIDSNYAGNMYSVIDWRVINKSCIVNNKIRNNQIVESTAVLIDESKNPLILVQQISHGEELAMQISALGYSVYMMQGGRKISVYSAGRNIDNYVDNDNLVLKDFDEGKIDALIGTSTLDEGADIPTLAAVILAGGGKGRLKTIQKVGRAMRKKSGLNCTFIIDFRDRFNVVTKSHFSKRKALYDEMGMSTYYVENTSKIKDTMQSLEEIRRLELESESG